MSKIKKIIRIRAFTIIEMVITLLISGVVVAISYFALLTFNRQLLKYRRLSAVTQSVLLFKSTLQRDIDRCSMLTDSVDQISCWSGQGKTTLASYYFAGDYIVRSAEAENDTFQIPSKLSDKRYMSDILKLVQSLEIKVRAGDESLTVLFFKIYTASELMDAEKTLHEQ